MKFRALLPKNREAEGVFHVTDDAGAILAGPFRCRGEADNANAAEHANVTEDPTKVGGDHPYGVYRVVDLVEGPTPEHSYGPFFFRLSPVSGEALEAWKNGRRGVGAHGGDLDAQGRLRATYGCLRMTNDDITTVARFWLEERIAGRDVFYTCQELV